MVLWGDNCEKESSCPVDHCLKFRRTCPALEPGRATCPASEPRQPAPSFLLLPQELGKNPTCLFPVPNSTRATPKKWDMPVSSSELHTGSNQKMVGACFQFRGTSKAQVPLVLSSITFLPGIEARPRHLPSIDASCRGRNSDFGMDRGRISNLGLSARSDFRLWHFAQKTHHRSY